MDGVVSLTELSVPFYMARRYCGNTHLSLLRVECGVHTLSVREASTCFHVSNGGSMTVYSRCVGDGQNLDAPDLDRGNNP